MEINNGYAFQVFYFFFLINEITEDITLNTQLTRQLVGSPEETNGMTVSSPSLQAVNEELPG